MPEDCINLGHANSPWASVIKMCSNGGSSNIISEVIAKTIRT